MNYKLMLRMLGRTLQVEALCLLLPLLVALWYHEDPRPFLYTIVPVALLGFGFFLAGIYPGCIANAGPIIGGSTMGMSVLTAISAMGGIITPQLVGSAADRIGLVAAIGILSVNVIVVIVLSAINFKRLRQR